MTTKDYVLRTAADWIFRRRSPALALWRSGALLSVVALSGGWLIQVAIKGDAGSLAVGIDTGATNGWLGILQIVAFSIGSILIAIGVRWEIVRQRGDAARSARRKVIVIEQRGLKPSLDRPLVETLPDTIEGYRDSLIVDIRERIRDGVVTAPEVALERIVAINRDIDTRIAGRDRADIEMVYGGLLPVPFTFLTGMLLDDEGGITVFDWDRDYGAWRQLDGPDDGDRFLPAAFPLYIKSEVVIALSVSYQVNLTEIARTFSGVPLVHLQLTTKTSNGHWSLDKQVALARAFFDTVKKLSAQGATRIHLIIAAPNSVVFRLGRIYDKRNLPDAIVYQYEQSSTPAYPWGVRLPTHGVARAELVYRDPSH
jgi:hypothetical protein